ncbi:signal transduction histidine kinase [Murinocardiopsis flavida]|uniref:histidine kinase n=1 Tax=Murinocardiopsis flavida TaxID=645275 RepID=A0A2P8DDU2_9ACTN|nr:histidine kinase [Murinocardiopsis flavida]PSK95355.1 signal transduction histidine kinase [Murinocardiopsis flavida]
MRQDAVLTVLLAPVVFAPATAPLGAQFGDLAHRPLDVWGVLLSAALWLPLVVRQRWPGMCLSLVAVAFAGYELIGYPQTCASFGLYIALYSVGAHGGRIGRIAGTRLVAAALSLLYVLFAVGLNDRGSPQEVSDYVLIYLVLVGCWAVGRAIRAWRDADAERRRLHVAAAIAEERAHIARELHDVVTHHVTAMVVQADAAGLLLADAPDRAATGLATISGSGRHALTDLHHLLGVLKAPADPSDTPTGGAARRLGEPNPAPHLDRLSDLVEQSRTAGQPVELTERGKRPRRLASAVKLTVYRVAQESLTNALKYAPGDRTLVHVHYRSDELDIEVTTEQAPGQPAAASTAPQGRGGGFGLVGLRERVNVSGGELSAGPRPAGGFSVRARIPYGEPV